MGVRGRLTELEVCAFFRQRRSGVLSLSLKCRIILNCTPSEVPASRGSPTAPPRGVLPPRGVFKESAYDDLGW
jgi:hypothetical protein